MTIVDNKSLAVFAGCMLMTFGLAATDLAMTGCGGGNSGGGALGSASVDPEDASDFSGSYVLRDTDCEPFNGLLEFSVEQTGTDLAVTVTKAEGDLYAEGDFFAGTVIEGGVQPAAGIDGVSCISQFVLDQQYIDVVESLSDVDVQVGDLSAFCGDQSPDLVCFAIYRHSD